jgi:hypothetical protein
MKTTRLSFLVLIPLLAPATAFADGAFFEPFGRAIWEFEQLAYLGWNEAESTETLVILPRFYGDAREFAWVVPVPAVPQVTAGDPELFRQLFTLVAPEYHHRDSSWDCDPTFEADGDADGPPPDVEIIWHDLVDIYDVMVVQAHDGPALADSLTAWGFLHEENSDQAQPLLADYVARGWSFAVMTIDSTAYAGGGAYGGLNPLALTFATTEPVYPMRLSALSAANDTEVRLFVAADHRLEFPGARTEYANRFDDAEFPILRRRYPEVAALLQPGRFLTCLEVTLGPQDMTDDLYLARAPRDDEFRRVVHGDFSLFGAFLAGSTFSWVAWKARRARDRRLTGYQAK